MRVGAKIRHLFRHRGSASEAKMIEEARAITARDLEGNIEECLLAKGQLWQEKHDCCLLLRQGSRNLSVVT